MKVAYFVVVSSTFSCCLGFSVTSNLSFSRLRITRITSTNNDNPTGVVPTSAQIEAEKLRDQVRKIREQLAQLEKKSLEEVENEALEKKKTEQLHLQDSGRKESVSEEGRKSTRVRSTRIIVLPETSEEQICQAALAVERAFADGITRQTVRLALVRENQLISSDEDEWPGGTREMFREAGRPLSESLLSEIRAMSLKNITSSSNTPYNYRPPTIKTQDILDFDGSALITAESANGPSGDVQAMVFANTDTKYIYDIRDISKTLGMDRLFILINPFWKDLESWGVFNLFAPGGKRLAKEIIFDSEGGGFQETYVLSRWTVRGENVAAVKAYPYDWELFAYLEDDTFGSNTETAIRLGSTPEKPTSANFTELLNSRPEFKIPRTMRQFKRSF